LVKASGNHLSLGLDNSGSSLQQTRDLRIFPKSLDAESTSEVRSTWLPIRPIKRHKMNDLTLANRAADWHRLKALVLDSVSSPITKRVYNLGLDEFIAWYGQEPRRCC
jgi:hypothetical protein